MIFKLKTILVVTAITLFAVSCEQVAISDQIPQIDEVPDTNSALVHTISSDQSVTDMLGYILFEQTDNDFVSEYREYFNNTLLVNYPELAKMELNEAESVIGEVISSLQEEYIAEAEAAAGENIDLRCGGWTYSCDSGKHWCCIFLGHDQAFNCFWHWCNSCLGSVYCW